MASKDRKKPVQLMLPAKEKARWVEHAVKFCHGNTSELLRRAVEEKMERDIKGEPHSEEIKFLRQEIQRLWETLAKRDDYYIKNTKLNIQDIIECLGSTDEIMLWKIEDIQQLCPISKEEINTFLRTNREMFELLPGGWRLREPDWKPDLPIEET